MSLSTYYFPEQVEEENRGELANPVHLENGVKLR